MKATVTPHWLLDPSKSDNKEISDTANGTFKLLNCGEEAFGAVYDAIASARKSISIINLGFQPSMYFKRGNAVPFDELLRRKKEGKPISYREGRALPIGELLIQKAAEGVKVRVLAWTFDVLSINAVGRFFADSPVPGRGNIRWGDRSYTHSDEQYQFDVACYDVYDRNLNDNLKSTLQFLGFAAQSMGISAGEWIKDKFMNLMDKNRKNLEFRSRGFSNWERLKSIGRGLINAYDDKNLSDTAKLLLAVFASHHQKTVLVDPEDTNVVPFS
jgi:phosphatidylserine/phosphatidylglycerophosphate/cardiolipin synthase-like enzyme